jgi:hypothetical protein
MKSKTSLIKAPIFSDLDLDLKRTERPNLQEGLFNWDRDILVKVGQARLNMTKALSQLSPSLKASFKQNSILFSMQGDYSPHSYITIFTAFQTSLNAHPTSSFNTDWIAKALTGTNFHRNKKGITRFFLIWQESDNEAISQDALNLLDNTASLRAGPRSVLSDDPNKSWLTNEEYDGLLSVVWDNYDKGISGTQVTLIRLLSLQYARRPIQISYLKIGDIRENDGSDSFAPIGKVIYFPGVKDMSSESGFRDSKFEPHSLADHLWDLCHIQRQEIRALYEYMLDLSLTDDQLNELPLFCSKLRVEQSLQIFEDQYQLNVFENLDSELFHLRNAFVSNILNWKNNTPTSDFESEKLKCSLRPKPPISPRTGHMMAVNATRIRHTRARQLARQGIPNHMLSHWLGHTSEKSIAAYYNDPAEQARQLDEAMAPVLAPIAMAFAGTLIDSTDQATRASDQTSKLELARAGELKNVGHCGKFSFCATTSVPIPCYRCKYFEPLVDAPHQELLDALELRQAAEEKVLKIGGPRDLLIPIDLSVDIRAVKNCIERCNARIAERGMNP